MDHDHIDAHDVSSRYVAGRLADDEERDFEAHLVDCQTCIDAVESEMSLRKGLRIVGAVAAPRWTAQAAAQSFAAPRADAFLRVAAGLLLAVSIGLGAWLSRSAADADAVRSERDQLQQRARQAEQSVKSLERRLTDAPAAGTAATPPRQPQVLPAAVFALATVRGPSSAGAAPVNRIQLERHAPLVVLSVEVPPMSGSGGYEVSLKDRASRLLWSGAAFRPSSSDAVSVAVDRALLPDGDYVLEVAQRSADRLTSIGRYTFRVQAR